MAQAEGGGGAPAARCRTWLELQLLDNLGVVTLVAATHRLGMSAAAGTPGRAASNFSERLTDAVSTGVSACECILRTHPAFRPVRAMEPLSASRCAPLVPQHWPHLTITEGYAGTRHKTGLSTISSIICNPEFVLKGFKPGPRDVSWVARDQEFCRDIKLDLKDLPFISMGFKHHSCMTYSNIRWSTLAWRKFLKANRIFSYPLRPYA